MKRLKNLSEITRVWINSIPKTINDNGCWIPQLKSRNNGYVPISINKKMYYLHRVVMCIYNQVNYFDLRIETRHNTGCDRACFFHEHLKFGLTSDNTKDSVNDKTHQHSRKQVCPICGSNYKIFTVKFGWSKGQIRRRCLTCDHRTRSPNRNISDSKNS